MKGVALIKVSTLQLMYNMYSLLWTQSNTHEVVNNSWHRSHHRSEFHGV